MQHETYLVQRLDAPHGEVANPFSFGGGLLNGGLTKQAMGLLNGVFTFDYMGSAEFEFGAVPEALSRIHKAAIAGDLIVGTVLMTESAVVKVTTWDRKRQELPLKSDPVVYFICPKAWESEVVGRILGLAGHRLRLKEASMIEYALRPDPERSVRVGGWLELDNGWFCFTDSGMFERVAALFGVETALNKEAANDLKAG